MPSRQRNVGYCAPTAQEEVKIALAPQRSLCLVTMLPPMFRVVKN
jgi:hypothetical protein